MAESYFQAALEPRFEGKLLNSCYFIPKLHTVEWEPFVDWGGQSVLGEVDQTTLISNEIDKDRIHTHTHTGYNCLIS